jgi:hypothetical protein
MFRPIYRSSSGIIWIHIRTPQFKKLSLCFYGTCLMMTYKEVETCSHTPVHNKQVSDTIVSIFVFL